MEIISLEEALEKAKVLKRTKNDAEKYDSSTGPQPSLSAIKNEEFNGVSELHAENLETTKNGTSQVAAASRPFGSSNARLLKCQNYGLQHPKLKCPAFGKRSLVVKN